MIVQQLVGSTKTILNETKHVLYCRNLTRQDIGKTEMYLLSDLRSCVTGENHYVDAGYQVVGMKAEDLPDIDVVTKRK